VAEANPLVLSAAMCGWLHRGGCPRGRLLRDETIKHAFGLGVFAPVNQDKKIKINKIME
jgi:hypothetical protein